MKNKLKKAFSLMLGLLTLICAVPFAGNVKAATKAYPALSSTAYCEFTASKALDVFTAYQITKPTPAPDNSLRIAAGTVCYIHRIDASSGYLYVKNTKTGKLGYVELNAVLEAATPIEAFISAANVTTYKKSGTTYQNYGSIDKSDKAYTINVSGNYVQVMYPVGSHWKLGWIKFKDYANAKGIPFTDVDQSDSFFRAVKWAYNRNIAAGTYATKFSPNQECTRAQIVTFLWRKAGSPEPKSTKNPFVDVSSNHYYYKPVLWAVEHGITAGTDATHFSPDQNCTRAQAITFLWRSAGSPEPKSTNNPFVDVSSTAYYYKPVLWAAGEKITLGTDATHFSPNEICTRAQIVTLIYRFNFAKAAEKLIKVAASQIGNVGGKPYWSWYGHSGRVEWCACFVSWCADQCGYIETGAIPKYDVCDEAINTFFKPLQWAEKDIEPAPGMIIFFDWDNKGNSGPQDGKSDHTGIVERVENGIVYTIEGNWGDRCCENEWSVGYYEILGYGIPNY